MNALQSIILVHIIISVNFNVFYATKAKLFQTVGFLFAKCVD